MLVDYLKLQEAMDERVVHLKRFEGQLNNIESVLQDLKDFQDALDDLYICYNNLDREARLAVAPHISTILEMEQLNKKFAFFLGDDENQVGFRHLFKVP
jgi:DNA-binding FrmR family transcriptional regulator